MLLLPLRSLTRALPLLLIPVLLPAGSPHADAKDLGPAQPLRTEADRLIERMSKLGVWV